MKRRSKIFIIILIILLILEIVFFINKTKNDSNKNNFRNNNMKTSMQQSNNSSSNSTNSENASSTSTKISTSAEIESSLSENVDLHATYYLKECLVNENEQVSAGENILEYTNGKYLTAPYDCVITKINLPEVEEKITNEHYITIESTNSLKVSISVSEENISKISVGDTATIKISALDDEEIEGKVTSISSTANNGKFTVVIEFENTGKIKIGMTADVSI